jgi:hypothetical protein
MGTTGVACTATDTAGNTSIKGFTVTVRDTTAPLVTEAATPTSLLWSPNKTLTPVTVSGKVSDVSGVTAAYKVTDEYGYNQPAGTITLLADGSYTFTVRLEAWRKGTDADGRRFTITVTAKDAYGNTSSAVTYVWVPHN